jgi:tetratricopeptide (TPR) repeat protein
MPDYRRDAASLNGGSIDCGSRQEAQVQRSEKRFKGVAAGILPTLIWVGLVAALTSSVTTVRTYAQEKQKKVKDQGEYDLFNSYTKETDPAKKLQYLNQWVDKYPESDYQEEQLRFYSDLNQPLKVLDLGAKILAKDPKNFAALSLITANIRNLPNATPDQLALGQKAAQTLVDNLDALKPAAVSDDAWKQARPGVEKLGKDTLLYITMKPGSDAEQKKDYVAAEQVYTRALQKYPDSADIAYRLGSVLVSQRNPDKFPQAIYQIARAVAMDPAKGGLPQQTRAQVETYLDKIYTQYHGPDDDGLKQLKALALGSPTPPAGFRIETQGEIAARKAEQFKKDNPQLALWMGIKGQLSDMNGEQYFESEVKNADIPKLKGTLVDAKPACRSKELTVAISDATHAEVLLKLDMALTGKPKTGTEIQFKGVPSAFVKDPFMLTMDTEKANLDGVETEACAAAPARRGGARRSPAKKE